MKRKSSDGSAPPSQTTLGFPAFCSAKGDLPVPYSALLRKHSPGASPPHRSACGSPGFFSAGAVLVCLSSRWFSNLTAYWCYRGYSQAFPGHLQIPFLRLPSLDFSFIYSPKCYFFQRVSQKGNSEFIRTQK